MYLGWRNGENQFWDRLIKVEHASVTSLLLNQILEIGENVQHQWLEEGEDHVDFP